MIGLCSLVGAEEGTSPEAKLASAQEQYEKSVHPLLTDYCLKCHGPEKQKHDINFADYATGAAAINAIDKSLWKRVVTQVRSRQMPPEKESKLPTDAERDQIIAWVAGLKRLAPRDPGLGVIRRLSRAEYANTLHDLLGVETKVADDLPADMVGEGFNSSISPLLMEKYLLVTDEVLDQLVKPDQLKLSWNAGEMSAVVGQTVEEGKPDGGDRTINGPGEIWAVIPAPTDGKYTIKIRAGSQPAGNEPVRLAVRIGDQVVGEVKVLAPTKKPSVYSVTCKIAAGKAKLSLLIVNPYVAAPTVAAPKGQKGGQQQPPAAKQPDGPETRSVLISSVEVIGPPASTPSAAKKRLLGVTPGKDLPKRDAAKSIAETFAKRAYRRPPTASEIETLLKVFDLSDSQDEVFSESVKLMLKAALMSPQFFYITPDAPPSGTDDIVPIGDYQLASKLSYLFWATMPDDELMGLADAGKLRDPAVIEQQVKRLIADKRSRALFDGFGAQWLQIDKIDELSLDEKKYPPMTNKGLRRAMYEEAAMLFDTIMREDRSIIEFVTCDYTFMNSFLAPVYGMEDSVKGAEMRKVQLTDANRGGILTLPAVLAITSQPNRTSPVKRGKWVLAQILGEDPPRPPGNVPPLEQQNKPENAKLNLRQRTELHRTDPNCAACHQTIDPIGFGLENFDAMGRWREKDDTGQFVDAVGELPGKVKFRSPKDLKAIIAGRKDAFCRTVTAKLLAYSLCRTLGDYDETIADDIAAAAAKDGYKMQKILVGIVTSYPFLNRRLTNQGTNP